MQGKSTTRAVWLASLIATVVALLASASVAGATPAPGCSMQSGFPTQFSSQLLGNTETVQIENTLNSNMSAPQHLVVRTLNDATNMSFKMTDLTSIECTVTDSYPIGAGDHYNAVIITGNGVWGQGLASQGMLMPGYNIRVEVGDFGIDGNHITAQVFNTSTGALVWENAGWTYSGSETEVG